MFQQLVDTVSNVIDSLLNAYLAVFFDQGFARQALFMGLVRWMGSRLLWRLGCWVVASMLATGTVKMLGLTFKELVNTMSNVLDFRLGLAHPAVHFNQCSARLALISGWCVTCMLAMYAMKMMRVLMFQQMVNAGSNVIDSSPLTHPAVF